MLSLIQLQYLLQIYSPLGPLLSSFSPLFPSFSATSTFEDPGLGIRCFSWVPSGRWAAVGGWDGKIRIVESESGHCVAVMSWPTRSIERDTVSLVNQI